eukprot:Awhi_evm1s1190
MLLENNRNKVVRDRSNNVNINNILPSINLYPSTPNDSSGIDASTSKNNINNKLKINDVEEVVSGPKRSGSATSVCVNFQQQLLNTNNITSCTTTSSTSSDGSIPMQRSISAPNVRYTPEKYLNDFVEAEFEQQEPNLDNLFLSKPITREVKCKKHAGEDFGAKFAFINNNYYVIAVTVGHYIQEVTNDSKATKNSFKSVSGAINSNQFHGQTQNDAQQQIPTGRNNNTREPIAGLERGYEQFFRGFTINDNDRSLQSAGLSRSNNLDNNMDGKQGQHPVANNIKYDTPLCYYDTPAHRLGLSFGDRIIAVNCVKARNMSMADLYKVLSKSTSVDLKIEDAKSLVLKRSDLFSTMEFFHICHPHLHKLDKELEKIAKPNRKKSQTTRACRKSNYNANEINQSLSVRRHASQPNSDPSSPPSEFETTPNHDTLVAQLRLPANRSRTPYNTPRGSLSDASRSAPSSSANSVANSVVNSPQNSAPNSPTLIRKSKSSDRKRSSDYKDNKHNFLNYHDNQINDLEGYDLSDEIKSLYGHTIIQIDEKSVINQNDAEVVETCKKLFKKRPEISITVIPKDLALNLKAVLKSLKGK